jgi:hypothetical protein
MNKYYSFFGLFLLLIIGCEGDTVSETRIKFNKIDDVSAAKWDELSKKRILFGHQSVGDNILDGVSDLTREHSLVHLRVKPVEMPGDLVLGTFGHFPVGKNENPVSKLSDFSQKIHNGFGENADIAFFKLCFVDVEDKTDADKLFNDYKNIMASLKKEYPKITFIHVTVPLLRKDSTGIKVLIRRILGKPRGFFDNAHNVRRNYYNNLIRAHYAGKETVFDLAEIESTHPDGSRESFTFAGNNYYALAPEFTDDGGHLNRLGRMRVAEQLLVLLSTL